MRYAVQFIPCHDGGYRRLTMELWASLIDGAFIEPADGYYAWEQRGTGPKQPWFVTRRDGAFKASLRRAGYVTRDARMVEHKKIGLHKARRTTQFSKR